MSDTPKRKLKLPAKLPIWRAKAAWSNTAVILEVPAKNEADAKEKAWNRVSRTEGGDSCLRVTILGLKD